MAMRQERDILIRHKVASKSGVKDSTSDEYHPERSENRGRPGVAEGEYIFTFME